MQAFIRSSTRDAIARASSAGTPAPGRPSASASVVMPAITASPTSGVCHCWARSCQTYSRSTGPSPQAQVRMRSGRSDTTRWTSSAPQSCPTTSTGSPPTFRAGMRVPVRLFATEELLGQMDEQVFAQAAEVATLPGIVGHSFAMPDAHWGYGFPIGGVAAMDAERGVISPGGIGFDINCGMRLALTNLTEEEVRPRIRELVDALFARVPAGVGTKGLVKLGESELGDVLEQGAGWCRRHGFATEEDLDRTEERGCFAGADVARVSPRALERGGNQLGTLGSGNHYLEIQVARPEGIADPDLAARFGISRPNQVVVMFHCGSRGFGHQVATDYLEVFLHAMKTKHRLEIADRQLACAPFRTSEGQKYFAAMQFV